MKYLFFLIGMIVAGCSGNGSGPTSQGSDSAWPAHWCEAQPGMSKEALVRLMGPPSTTPPDEIVMVE